jgi:hypothetical protein
MLTVRDACSGPRRYNVAETLVSSSACIGRCATALGAMDGRMLSDGHGGSPRTEGCLRRIFAEQSVRKHVPQWTTGIHDG